jgi:hypothetical protein
VGAVFELPRPWQSGDAGRLIESIRRECGSMLRGPEPPERDDFSSNHHPALSFCLSMISAQTLRVCREEKPVSTFPDHALAIKSQSEANVSIGG